MATESEVILLHHIPTAAIDWNLVLQPLVGFRFAFKAADQHWKNSPPAWVAAYQYTLSMKKDDKV
jgi:hypothetical protein